MNFIIISLAWIENGFLISFSANNDTMDSLDLSWNHLRRDGGVLVAEGLAVSVISLTHKAPPIICSRRQFQVLPLFQN